MRLRPASGMMRVTNTRGLPAMRWSFRWLAATQGSRHAPRAVRCCHGTRSVPATLGHGTRSVPATLGHGTRSVPATFRTNTGDALFMLSRVADALFWMSRYLERAEHVARLFDVCFHQEVD